MVQDIATSQEASDFDYDAMQRTMRADSRENVNLVHPKFRDGKMDPSSVFVDHHDP